jgi:carbon-monoxide dehydrogenase large subunit
MQEQRPGITRTTEEGGIVGQSVRRLEDPHLITGRGTFIDDLKRPGLLHLHIIRSTQAHARIRAIETGPASRAPGVRLVLTGGEVCGEVGPLPVRWDTPGLRCRDYPPMASDRVRYVGQPVALVVADDPYLAADAALLVEVAYDPLPVVVSVEAAGKPGAPLLYEEWGTNETCDPVRFGQGDTDAAFAEADHVVAARLYSHRYSGFPLESRGCLASYEPLERRLTIHTSTQAPNQVRTAIAGCLGVGKTTCASVRGMWEEDSGSRTRSIQKRSLPVTSRAG